MDKVTRDTLQVRASQHLVYVKLTIHTSLVSKSLSGQFMVVIAYVLGCQHSEREDVVVVLAKSPVMFGSSPRLRISLLHCTMTHDNTSRTVKTVPVMGSSGAKPNMDTVGQKNDGDVTLRRSRRQLVGLCSSWAKF